MSDALPAPLGLVAGERLADPGWLAERVDATARWYRTQHRGVAATLWWYSSSIVLLGPSLHALAMLGTATRLDPGSLRLELTPYGTLARVVAGEEPVDGGAAGLGRHLDDALDAVVTPLVEVSGVRPQRLWAVAADSLANRLLHVRRPDLAGPVAEASRRLRPVPRFVDAGGQTFVRRGSCCLIFRIPGEGLCASCPRQLPAERQERLLAQARYLRGLG